MARAERPLGPGDGPVLQLAADLRELRQRAGLPPYRELSRRANYSVGALSDAAGGRRLPSLALTLAYAEACGGDAGEWTRKWKAAAVAQERVPQTTSLRQATDDDDSPYAGLAAFGEADADRFFGRAELISELRGKVARHRFVVVTGASGSGKSSLVRAGLLPHVPSTHTIVLRPGPRPLEELAARLVAHTSGGVPEVLTSLREDVASLHLIALGATAGHSADDLVLVVDQFEELFTRCRDAGHRSRFLELLHHATTAPNSRTRVVAGLRADFFGRCTHHSELSGPLRDGQVVVGPMSPDELRAAIVEPAVAGGYRVENALTARVVADATGQPGVLPLVSHALRETWRRRRGTLLTVAGYRSAGGITQAIARTAEAIHGELDAEEQRWARQLFLRLTELGEGVEDTARRVCQAELDLDHPAAAKVLERLVSARLVTLDQTGVRITHEALIRCWPRLRDWLDEDRDLLRLHRQVTDAAAEWAALDRDRDALYRGARLDLVHDLDAGASLTPQEREFLEASRAAAEADAASARRRTRRRHVTVGALVVLLLLTTGTMVYAIRAENEVSRQRDEALAEKVTRDAVVLRTTAQPLAVQLALAAHRLAPSQETGDGLLSSVATTLAGHTGVISSVAFSPRGGLLATGSFDHTARLWDISRPDRPTPLAVLTAHDDLVTAVAFSPDGRLLATTSRDRSIRLWRITDPRHPVQLGMVSGHTDTVFSLAYSPDGRTIATGSYDRTVRLWDVRDPAHPSALAVLTAHTMSVKPVVFSPNGRMLASGSDDRTIRLWDVTNPRHPAALAVLTGHKDIVSALAFAPDGATLASGSNDHTVRLWDIREARHPVPTTTLTGHTDIVGSLAFAPDGRTLASSGYDHTIRLWHVDDNRHVQAQATLTGHTGAVNAVAFSSDSRTLASGSDDHTAQLWGTDIDRAETKACALAHPVITPDQWNHHFRNVDYAPPC